MVENIVSAAQTLNAQNTSQQLQVTAAKKAIDIQKQEAASLLSPLEVSPSSSGEPGGKVDIRI